MGFIKTQHCYSSAPFCFSRDKKTACTLFLSITLHLHTTVHGVVLIFLLGELDWTVESGRNLSTLTSPVCLALGFC